MTIKILDIKKVQQVHGILQDLGIKTSKTGYSDVFEIPKSRFEEFAAALNRSGIRYEKQSKLKEILRPIVQQILKEAKTSMKLKQSQIRTEAKNTDTDYYLVVDLDERGEYSATVYNSEDKVVWDVDTGVMGELIDDGFLKYKAHRDLDRLAKYLGDVGIIPKHSTIYSERDWEDVKDDLDERKTSTKTRLKEILRPIVQQILKEAKSSMNLEQPHSNLYIKGWGFDTNGNWRIIVGLPNDRGIAIQTSGKLHKTDSITRGAKKLTDDELSIIGQEITDYVSQYGSASLKSKLKIYKK